MANEIQTNDPNPYASYAAKIAPQEGQFLGFKTGEWTYGQDGETLPIGTKLVANIPGLRVGWRRWWSSKLTDDMTELLTDLMATQRQAPRRDTLGEMDEGLWEIGTDGKTRDPWVMTYLLDLATDEGEIYLFSTSSKGGIGAIGKLLKAYALEYRQRPGMVPIVELGNDFYMHPVYKKTYFPVFTIVGWTDENEPSTTPQAAITPPSKGNGKGKNSAVAGPDPSDEIPF
jgi:hypothetical protein